MFKPVARVMSAVVTEGVCNTGEVSVLFVKVSVVALPTKVSVLVGKVSVPVLTIVAITGAVRVLLVKVWVAVVPTNEPAGAAKPSNAVPPALTRIKSSADKPESERLAIGIVLESVPS